MSSGTFSILQTIVPNVTNNSIKLTFHMNCLFIECGHDMENVIFHEKIVNELKLIGYNDVEIVEVNKYVNSHPVALADATRTHSANSISTVWTNIMSENENGHVEGFEENVGTFYNDNDVLTP